MKELLYSVLTLQPIMGVTINTVYISGYFTLLVYAVLFISAVVSILLYLRKGYALPDALRRGLGLGIVVSALFYLLHSESVWYNWLAHDWKSFSGLSSEEKLLRLEGPLYDFARRLKDLIPEDSSYTLYSTEEYFPERLEYFLLPRKRVDDSRNIIVLADSTARFDPFSGTLRRGDKVITNLEPYFYYADDAYMVRKR